MTLGDIPSDLWPHFQEYDVRTLDLDRDANLIIQRTLECCDYISSDPAIQRTGGSSGDWV